MTGMTIAALAREGGVGVETVRYYQRRGLLDEPDPTPASAAPLDTLEDLDFEMP